MYERDLQKIEIFKDLGAQELRRLARAFVEVDYPANHEVFRQGDLSEAFYVIRTGRVVLTRSSAHGDLPEEVLGHVGPSQCFGEFGILDELRRSASARTTEPSLILAIRKQDLLKVFALYPTIALRLAAAARRQGTTVPGLGRRRETRTRVNKQVAITMDDGLSMLTRLINLSRGGLCFKGVPPGWTIGREVGFELAIAGQTLALEARVCWIAGEHVGVAFVHRSPDHSKNLQWAMRLLSDGASPVEDDEWRREPRLAHA